MRVLFGRLRWCTDSAQPEFWPWEGEPFSVLPVEAPLEKPIEATFEGDRLVSWRRDERLAAEYNDTRLNVALVLVLSSPPDEKDWERVRNSALLLLQEYRRYSRGRWDVHVTPYAVQGPVANSIHSVDWRKLRELVGDINPEHSHTHWHCWSGYNNQFSGLAWTGGTQAWTAGNAQPATTVHETGHNKGLGHDGEGASAYGNRRSWQGNRPSRYRFIAPSLYHMGLLDEYVKHEEGAARYFLVDTEALPLALRSGETQMVLVDRDRQERYAVALERDRVYVYRTNPAISKRWASTWQLAELRAGQSVELEQVSVAHIAHKDGASEVVVKWDHALPDPAQASFPVAVLPDNAQPVLAGNWETVEHQGLRLQLVHGKLVGYWYTWDLKQRPRWYEVHGTLVDNVAHLELRTTRMVGRRRERLHVGDGTLYCTDGENGVLRATTTEHGRMAIRIKRVSTPLEQRIFGFADADLEGISTSRNDTPNGIVRAGFWFRYKDNRQDWLLIDGNDLYRPSHGSFNVDMDSEMLHVGTCSQTADRFTAQLEGEDYGFSLVSLA